MATSFCRRFLRYFAVFAVVISPLVSSASGYKHCSFQYDCSNTDSCCRNRCVYGSDCLGHVCSDDNECRSWENCCDGICSDDDCLYSNVGAIVGIVIGCSILLCLLSLCCYYACYRPSRRYRGRVIVGQRVTATTITTRCATQSNTPYQYQGQVPPSYQQGYLYHPPPQYVQYSPYNAGSTKSSEPPPPYSGAPEGRSGGVYAPQSNYGAAVQNPSAPLLEQ
ncbi:uncharacterized protein LOC144653965 [Oculina patagonica]